MGSVSSLSKFFNWHTVLELLEIPKPAPVLPATITCPACRRPQYRIYRDCRFGGEWLHCLACDHHGTIIELAADTWKLDLWRAAIRLAAIPRALTGRMPDSKDIAAGVLQQEQRGRYDAFWKLCQGQIETISDNDLRSLMQKYGILTNLNAGNWQKTAGRLIGAAHRDQIEQYLRASKHPRHTILKGGKWSYALAIPYYDLPGRIASFQFIGRLGLAADRVCHTLHGYSDPGVAFLPTALYATAADFNDTVFNFADTKSAVRLQMRWLRSSTRFLPIVLHHPDTDSQLWQSLVPRTHILCCSSLDGDQLQAARNLRAKICIYSLTIDEENKRMPTHTLQHLRRNARPWRQAVEQQLRALPPEQAGHLLHELKFTRAAAIEFVRGCDKQLQLKLAKVLTYQEASREVKVDGKIVVETEQGWFVGECQICNGRLRLERHVADAAGQRCYRGQILLKGEAIPLEVPISQLTEVGLFCCAAEIAAKAGHLLVYDKSWATAAERVALAFHTPTVEQSPSRIGWDQQLNGFRLAHYSLHAGGKISSSGIANSADPQLPTRTVVPPTSVPQQAACTLVNTRPWVACIWAMLAAMVRQIVGPLTRPAPSVAVLGSAGAHCLQAMTTAAGCITVVDTGRLAWSQLAFHNWPMRLELNIERPWLRTIPVAQNCLAVMPAEMHDIACIAGWDTIAIPEDTLPAHIPQAELAMLLPTYLHDVCKHNFAGLSRENSIEATLHDLSRWIREIHGRGFNVEQVKKIYTASTPMVAATAIKRFLQRYADSPQVKTVDAMQVTLSQQALYQVKFPWAFKLDIHATHVQLHAAGVLCDGPPGYWVFHRDWWDS